MSKQTLVPDEDHIARRAGRKDQIIINREFKGISRTLFELRVDRNEKSLSCDWLECFPGTRGQMIKSVRNAMQNRLAGGYELMKIAIMNVGNLKRIALENGVKVRVINAGKRSDPSHSQIFGLPLSNQDAQLLEAMAEEGIAETVSYLEPQ